MILLTRIRHDETFYLNPDLFERVDTHVDTVVRLTNGHEYVVAETAGEIVRRIAEYRAQVIALAGLIRPPTPNGDDGPVDAAVRTVPGELVAGPAANGSSSNGAEFSDDADTTNTHLPTTNEESP